jgi:hypothetical protein
MKKRGSAGMKKPDAGSMKQAPDYGLGPEPPRYSPEWMEWKESRSQIKGLEELAK